MTVSKVLTKEQAGRLFADVQRLAALNGALQAVRAQEQQVREALTLQMDAYGIPQTTERLDFDLPALTVSWEQTDELRQPAADERSPTPKPTRRRKRPH